MAAGSVDRAILASYHKIVHVTKRKGHRSDSHCLALFKHQLQTVLQRECTYSFRRFDKSTDIYNSMSVNHSSSMHLWLGEHVEAPGTHFPISGNADKVVSVLGSYHVHTVNWVLNTTEHSNTLTKKVIQM